MTMAAIVGEFRLHQTFLGTKPHLDRGSADLVAAMRQTVGTLFWTANPTSNIGVRHGETGKCPLVRRRV